MAVTETNCILHFTAEDDAVTELYYVTHVKWFGEDIADGDELQLTDTAGNVLFDHFSTAADLGYDGDISFPARGIIAATMTSDHGTVTIYHK